MLQGSKKLAALLLLSTLVGCGGGSNDSGGTPNVPPVPPVPSSVTIGGSVTGLTGTLVLQQNAANNLSISVNGAFTFSGSVAAGSMYSVTIFSQPSGQRCSVAAGSGTAAASVTSVQISCVALYSIGGTVRGLSSSPVTLQINAGDDVTVSRDGAFAFPTAVLSGGAYAISVRAQPAGLNCSVSNGSGTASATVANVFVICRPLPVASFLPLVDHESCGEETNRLRAVLTSPLDQAPKMISDNFVKALQYIGPMATSGATWNLATNPTDFVYYGTGPGTPDVDPYKCSGFPHGYLSGTRQQHLYAVDLREGSTLVPRQIGTHTFGQGESPRGICEELPGYSDLNDPASAFWLFAFTAPDLTCPQPLAFHRVRFRDSPTTDPEPIVGPGDGKKHFLYAPDGKLAGLLGVDATHRLVLYHGEALASPTPVLENCNSFWVITPESKGASGFDRGHLRLPYAFIGASMTDGSNRLYRVDHTGALSAPFSVQPVNGQQFQDDTFLYFTATPSNSPDQRAIFRLRLDGTAAPESLYSETVSSSDSGPYILGVSGSRLVIARLVNDEGTNRQAQIVQSLDLDHPGTLTMIGTVATNYLRGLVLQDRVFLTTTTLLPSNAFVFDTYVFGLDGKLVEPKVAGAQFTGVSGDSVQRMAGMTDPAGARLELLTVAPDGSLLTSTLERTDGSNLHLPPRNFATTVTLPPSIGAGMAEDSTGSHAFVFDAARSTIAPVEPATLGFPYVAN